MFFAFCVLWSFCSGMDGLMRLREACLLRFTHTSYWYNAALPAELCLITSQSTQAQALSFKERLTKSRLQAQDGFDLPPATETDPESRPLTGVQSAKVALYSLVLTFGIFLEVVGPLEAVVSSDGTGRPAPLGPLTKARVHFYSFICMAMVWAAFGIMFASQTPDECNPRNTGDFADSGCGTLAANIALSFIECLLSLATAALLWTKTTGPSSHVGDDRGTVAWHEMAKQGVS
ncbi:hypothetical protein D9758_011582 [Tetrapyrgos nigripes]|uniref:Uncharacterized protein n=1 Tax=Tetrapyrgos nigripes TaxID=182062 RepID=A0A8H5FPL8_9AGAR|nr:hypothetical protein D9758_011582 [Tetrapyrgos nigripes]